MTEKKSKPEQRTPEWIARQEIGKFFAGANPKTLANLNSKGQGPKAYSNGRIKFYKYDELKKHFIGS